jgi:predicted metal-dependent hydrolase
MRSEWSITLNLADGPRLFQCQVLQQRGTRSMRLRVRDDGTLFLTCPPRVTHKTQLNFIEQNISWIANCLAQRPAISTINEHLQANPFLAGTSGPVAATIETGSPRSLLRFLPPFTTATFKMDDRREVWERDFKYLLRRYANMELPIRVNHWVRQHALGVIPKRVSIRDQSSRWGSCSHQKTLSLNWRLVLLPQHLADYVILHELAHLREMNHSSHFWQYLRELDPATDQHEAELKRIGPSIIRLGQGFKSPKADRS